jgi:deoxyribodipyrimidine photo-lyase
MNAPIRHFDFMFTGLKEIETDLKALNIPFFVLSGQAAPTITAFAQQVR